MRDATASALGLVLLLGAVGPQAQAKDRPSVSAAIDPLYREVSGGMFFDVVPPDTGPALTVDLGTDGRLVIPPRFAEQRTLEVKQMGGMVLVGLQASVPQGPCQAFALVYALDNRHGVLKATLPLRQYFVKFEESAIDGRFALIIHGASGMHFDDLWIYRFTKDAPELLLAQGSAAGVQIRQDAQTGNPQVWVGVEHWDDPHWSYASGEPLWNVYTWNGQAFGFNDQLSTAPLATVDERTNNYVQGVKATLEQLKPDEKRGGSEGGESETSRTGPPSRR